MKRGAMSEKSSEEVTKTPRLSFDRDPVLTPPALFQDDPNFSASLFFSEKGNAQVNSVTTASNSFRLRDSSKQKTFRSLRPRKYIIKTDQELQTEEKLISMGFTLSQATKMENKESVLSSFRELLKFGFTQAQLEKVVKRRNGAIKLVEMHAFQDFFSKLNFTPDHIMKLFIGLDGKLPMLYMLRECEPLLKQQILTINETIDLLILPNAERNARLQQLYDSNFKKGLFREIQKRNRTELKDIISKTTSNSEPISTDRLISPAEKFAHLSKELKEVVPSMHDDTGNSSTLLPLDSPLPLVFTPPQAQTPLFEQEEEDANEKSNEYLSSFYPL